VASILARQLGHEDADRLINAGFKFATIDQVGRNIANTVQIPLSTLEGYVADLRPYIDVDSAPKKSGTWPSCFAMISKPRVFDIAAPPWHGSAQQAELVSTSCPCFLKHRTNCITRSETVACAICLGLIGIWCMHFIGNRAGPTTRSAASNAADAALTVT
jgi:hypothetical protein